MLKKNFEKKCWKKILKKNVEKKGWKNKLQNENIHNQNL